MLCTLWFIRFLPLLSQDGVRWVYNPLTINYTLLHIVTLNFKIFGFVCLAFLMRSVEGCTKGVVRWELSYARTSAVSS